jgi:hypothetical protein
VIYPALFGPPSFSQIPGMRHPCRVWGLGVVGNGKWERGFVGDCCGSRPAVAPTGGSSWLLWFATGGRSYGVGPHGCCGSRPAVAPTGGVLMVVVVRDRRSLLRGAHGCCGSDGSSRIAGQTH